MHKTLLLAGLAGCLFASAASSDAFAKARKRAPSLPPVQTIDGEAIPLTVNRRSWLDSGNAVSTTQTAGPSYIADSTVFNKTQDRIFAPDGFGNDVIKGPPYVPGRTQPVVEFSSRRDGGVDVDNVLFPQNFYFNPTPELPPRVGTLPTP